MRTFLITLLPGALAVVFSASVHAALGEAEDSVTTDRFALSAQLAPSSTRAQYKVRSLQTDAATVREYVSGSGIVFGIAWNGLSHPDLSRLLGSYSSDYEMALRNSAQRPGVRARAIRGTHVVVEKWGHMRNLAGRAYDPSLLPKGVSIDEIR